MKAIEAKKHRSNETPLAMYRRFLSAMVVALFLLGLAKAQENITSRDSLRIEKDSIRIEKDSIRIERDSLWIEQDSLVSEKDSLTYSKFEKFSQKSKFTNILHHIFFRSTAPAQNRQEEKNKAKKLKSYRRAEGKIIRDIFITTLDPFGYNVQDTSVHPQGWMKAGNILHPKTQPRIIKNLLLFKRNEPYDSLLVKESERLIRSQKYVQDLSFITKPASGNTDSVDIYIRVLDVWSAIPSVRWSKSTIGIGLTDRNLAGLGNSFHGDAQWNRLTGNNVTRLSYFIPNIRNSYINFNIQYLFPQKTDLIQSNEFAKPYYSTISSNNTYLFSDNKGMLRSIEFSRSFYSPVAKWAGGIFLGQMITSQSYIQQDSIFYLSSRTNIQDYWAAKSWPVFKGKHTDARITNLILSARVLRLSYTGRPPEADQVDVFNKESIYFTGIGITSRKYIQDKYIFNFGRVEDVPVGRAFGITIGLDAQQANRFYLGLKAAWGNYYRFGFLSTRLEYGTFIGATGFQQEVVTGRISYFTRLLSLGNWKIRQFIRPTVVFGIKRLPADNLTFGDEMKGFGEIEDAAKHMIVLTLQTQSYAPWNLIGFRFGPYLHASFGMLGNESTGFNKSHLYAMLGLGILIKNEYLMFNTFQISLTFYPFLPGKGYNIFKTNSYKTSDYGFKDYEISKPEVADYR